jgi:hypothetical protein
MRKPEHLVPKKKTKMQQMRSWNKEGERENDPRQKIARMQPGKKQNKTKHSAIIAQSSDARERERAQTRRAKKMRRRYKPQICETTATLTKKIFR